MTIVITHPEMGVYLGNCLGLGFFSLLDSVGQTQAVTFATAEEASVHVRGWDENNDPAAYAFIAVPTDRPYATLSDLSAAGLGPMLGAMALNAAPAGHG